MRLRHCLVIYTVTKMKKVFIFGLGYTGERLARLLVSEGCVVGGTVRKESEMIKFSKIGVMTVLWDSNVSSFPQPMEVLDGVSAVLSTIQVHVIVFV